ncbi:PTS sugar transporter subunit IIB [Paenibacillus sp. 23TSA30-6]|uniref:PTS sugar transporter subunit IIB n=1 Tax=Paenibacillus sp. 23TSA30-6 TaxID=2546104 RepID=UPI00178819B3|nr:PTS sugar transporter subunit IIB [Paenibacillus sp. 23TSA30-6]MBE0339683.1 PTS sugar transporter subunit IIB [Paenibacillus sp. 23TSA30-6]
MKKIVLLCTAGMSTSMLVTKIREAAKAEGYDCDVNAYPVADASSTSNDADAILLGPQVRFQEKNLKQLFPDKPIEAIDMMSYGAMDGKKVLAQAKRMIGE